MCVCVRVSGSVIQLQETACSKSEKNQYSPQKHNCLRVECFSANRMDQEEEELRNPWTIMLQTLRMIQS